MDSFNDGCYGIRKQLLHLSSKGVDWSSHFKKFDLSNDGIISFEDFKLIFNELGLIIKPNEFRAILNAFCVNYKMLIDIKKFLNFLFFRIKEPDNLNTQNIMDEDKSRTFVSEGEVNLRQILIHFAKNSDDINKIDDLARENNLLLKDVVDLPGSSTSSSLQDINYSFTNTVPNTMRNPKIDPKTMLYDHSKKKFGPLITHNTNPQLFYRGGNELTLTGSNKSKIPPSTSDINLGYSPYRFGESKYEDPRSEGTSNLGPKFLPTNDTKDSLRSESKGSSRPITLESKLGVTNNNFSIHTTQSLESKLRFNNDNKTNFLPDGKSSINLNPHSDDFFIESKIKSDVLKETETKYTSYK